MTIELINVAGSVANIVVALAAAVTLLLVYFQLREMSVQTKALIRSIRSATYQNIVDSERELWQYLASDEEFMRRFIGEYKLVRKYGLSPKQALNVGLVGAHYENIYYQFCEGAVPETLWPEWSRAIVNNLKKSMIREVWPELRNWFWKDFSEFASKQFQSDEQSRGDREIEANQGNGSNSR